MLTRRLHRIPKKKNGHELCANDVFFTNLGFNYVSNLHGILSKPHLLLFRNPVQDAMTVPNHVRIPSKILKVSCSGLSEPLAQDTVPRISSEPHSRLILPWNLQES